MSARSLTQWLLARGRQSPLTCLLLTIVTVWILYRFFTRQQKQRYPDVPWLRMSELPGAAGEAADAQAFVQNGHEVIVRGYHQVCLRIAIQT
jgi:hypothetical protein